MKRDTDHQRRGAALRGPVDEVRLRLRRLVGVRRQARAGRRGPDLEAADGPRVAREGTEAIPRLGLSTRPAPMSSEADRFGHLGAARGACTKLNNKFGFVR